GEVLPVERPGHRPLDLGTLLVVVEARQTGCDLLDDERPHLLLAALPRRIALTAVAPLARILLDLADRLGETGLQIHPTPLAARTAAAATPAAPARTRVRDASPIGRSDSGSVARRVVEIRSKSERAIGSWLARWTTGTPELSAWPIRRSYGTTSVGSRPIVSRRSSTVTPRPGQHLVSTTWNRSRSTRAALTPSGTTCSAQI